MCGAVAAREMAADLGGVLVLDHASKPAEKVRISGGGRCNFTNLHSGPHNFISKNPHFCKSALAGYTPQDFIDLVNAYGIKWHEKNPDMGLGQLFCDGKSGQIIDMLLSECRKAKARVQLETKIANIEKTESGFSIATDRGSLTCTNLVVACGGPSIPKMGASGFGYDIAKQFGLSVIETVPALVPLVFTDGLTTALKQLSGVSVMATVSHKKTNFTEALLFTHRGLSGPSILQISSYWSAGEQIIINLCPEVDALEHIKKARESAPKLNVLTCIAHIMPRKLAEYVCRDVLDKNVADLNNQTMDALGKSINAWALKPAGSEGFRTAEVTRGGVNTKELSSKSMAAKSVKGLYFIGEVVDVTGHLGGHNFQWAWASAVACGKAIAASD